MKRAMLVVGIILVGILLFGCVQTMTHAIVLRRLDQMEMGYRGMFTGPPEQTIENIKRVCPENPMDRIRRAPAACAHPSG